jgi:hypothetical protein
MGAGKVNDEWRWSRGVHGGVKGLRNSQIVLVLLLVLVLDPAAYADSAMHELPTNASMASPVQVACGRP